jgi:DNA-binding transcriptional regulator YdaS (Cro superfamily)
MEKNLISLAAQIIGSRSALAKIVGVSKGAVWQWEHERRVPAEHCPVIERATSGAVRCEDLRPDVDWAYLRGTKKKAA